MEAVSTVAVTAAVSGVVGAVVSALVAAIKTAGHKAVEWTEDERAADEAMKAGMRALLWRELKTLHEQAVDGGGLSVAQRRHLESVYGAYHGLGGNGTGTRLYEDAIELPVFD